MNQKLNKSNKLNLRNARSRNQKKRMTLSVKNDICIFCKDGLKTIHKKPILKENNNFLVTENAFSYTGTSYHLLIIPKRHIVNLIEFKSEEWAVLQEIINWVIQKKRIKGGSLFLRFGDNKYNGGTIPHLHFQIILGNSSEFDSLDCRKKLKVTLGWQKKL